MRSEDINWFKNISNESACHSLKENQCKFHEMATDKFSPFSFIPVNNYSFEKNAELKCIDPETILPLSFIAKRKNIF